MTANLGALGDRMSGPGIWERLTILAKARNSTRRRLNRRDATAVAHLKCGREFPPRSVRPARVVVHLPRSAAAADGEGTVRAGGGRTPTMSRSAVAASVGRMMDFVVWWRFTGNGGGDATAHRAGSIGPAIES